MSNKQNRVMRFTADIWTTPHLISSEGFKQVSDYLEKRNEGSLMKVDEPISQEREIGYDAEAKIGVISLDGALTYRPVFSLSGTTGMSYTELLETASEMIDAGVKTIVLDINSGGGEAYSTFSTGNELRRMADEADVKLYAYCQSRTCSAAYALAVVCDEVIAHPQSEVGSIGVLCALYNDSKALEKEGIQRVFVTAGEDKIPYDADGAFTESFLSGLQGKIDTLYAQFVSHVHTYTGLSDEEIKATKARTFLAEEAKSLGLINQVMTQSEFSKYIASKQGASNA